MQQVDNMYNANMAAPGGFQGASQQEMLAAGMVHSASLYVGDLHQDVTEALLFDIFSAVGPVASIRVCRDAVTRRSLGYAYVNFHSATDAERALDTLNFTAIKGTPCRIMWSQRDPSLRKTGVGNVFVKSLDPSVDTKALFDTFSLFGEILSCKVVTDRNGVSKGYGFVHFETQEAADESIAKINGMLIQGKEVYVAKFQKRDLRPGISDWTNVYIKNVPLHWSKERLEDEFQACGAIASSTIMLDSEGTSRGFAFIDFVEHESALKAVELMNEKVVLTKLGEETGPEEEKEAEKESEKKEEAAKKEEATTAKKEEDEYETTEKPGADAIAKKKLKTRILYVGRAQKKSERERELGQKFEALKLERLQRFQGVNLFIKNLHEDVDDELLRKEFSAFGSITSARIMRDVIAGATPEQVAQKKEDDKKAESGEAVVSNPAINGPSKGFGFVCFTTPEEATKAVTEMNGKMILGKPIYVALAQRKDARRAQLEAHHNQRLNGGGMRQPTNQMYGGSPMYYQGNAMQQMPNRGGGFYQPMMTARNPQQMMPGMGRVNQMNSYQGGRSNYMGQQQMYGMPDMQGMQNNSVGRATQNRRNGRQNGTRQPRVGGMGGVGGGMMGQKYPVMRMDGQPEPLTAAALANATEDQQKNMIGERLYPLIFSLQPVLAGKITGMLLEMDNPELLHLIESPEALNEKIAEALQVLEAHAQQGTAEA